MKKLVIEDTNEGLLKLMGEVVTLYCASFIYSGKLIGVNDECVLLDDAVIVYDTGSHAKKEWELAEPMPHKTWYVMKAKIESFGVFKNGN